MMYTRFSLTLLILISLSITPATLSAGQFHDIVRKNKPAEIKGLHVDSLKVDDRDHNGETPVYLAAKLGYNSCVSILMEKGANCRIDDNFKRTPLHIAALNGHTIVVINLIQAGSPLNVYDRDGNTPLHYAVQNNHRETVEYLLEHCADIDPVNAGGFTPLYVAISEGHPEIAALLCAHGANLLISEEILPQILEAGFTDHISKRAELLASFNAFLEKCGPQRKAEVEAASIAAMVSANSKIKRDRSINSSNSVTPKPPTNCNNSSPQTGTEKRGNRKVILSPIRLREPISTNNGWRNAGCASTRLAQIKKGPE